MTIARETVYAAVYARLKALEPTIVTTGRRLRMLSDLSDGEYPACFQVQDAEEINHRDQLPPIYTFKLQWWLYTFEPGPKAAPSQQLNALIDLLEAQLQPDWAGALTQTLGLQVHRVWLAGPVEIFEGTVNDRAMAIVPINITVAGSYP